MKFKKRNILRYEVRHKILKLNLRSNYIERLPSMETVTPATRTVDAQIMVVTTTRYIE